VSAGLRAVGLTRVEIDGDLLGEAVEVVEPVAERGVDLSRVKSS
jgi:hypothetical protein